MGVRAAVGSHMQAHWSAPSISAVLSNPLPTRTKRLALHGRALEEKVGRLHPQGPQERHTLATIRCGCLLDGCSSAALVPKYALKGVWVFGC